MIYIISQKTDLVTDLVSEWLIVSGRRFVRFNDDEFIPTDDNYFNTIKVKKLWLRRGTFNLIPNSIFSNYYNRNSYIKYISNEIREYSFYLEYKLKQTLGSNYIGSFIKEVSSNNKLINLDIAESVGFKTPVTLITSSKKELIQFYRTHKSIITKDLRAPVNIKTRHKDIISTGVKLVNDQMLGKLKDYFAPIFTQKYIDKKYEIRAFIFSKSIYAMAIFSQKDKQTKVDYRNYNNQKQNRCVPVNLPKKIQDKIWAFMEETQMNTGSIDFIVTPKNEFYFLEINPMGQFHWLSANCNYYIEKDIANFLTS